MPTPVPSNQATWVAAKVCPAATSLGGAHDPSNGDGSLDYSDFEGRPVSRGYIDAKSAEAGLDP
jgi:hypothetical protein